jgi:hypothetical protein
MKVLVFVLLAALSWAPLGCGSNGSNGNPGNPGNPGVNGTASLSGNWQFTSNSTVFSGTTGNISASLATSGTAVTGIAHISSPCYQYITDVPLSGQISGNGTFTVSSGSVNSQILTITGTSLGSSISSGAYSIAGGCGAGDKGTVSGYTLAALTGTYSGTISDGLGNSVQVVAQLTQSPTANGVSGYYAATGSSTFSGSSCYSSGTTVASSSVGVLGNEFGIDFTTPGSNPSTVSMAGIFDAAAKTMTVQYYSVYGGLCSGSGTGTLTAQPVISPAITSVSVSCSPSSIQINGTSKCSATVTGAGVFNPAVNWVASSGSIDANGNYTAPGTATTATITATSVQDQSKSGTAQIDVQPMSSPAITSVSVSCSPSSIQINGTQDNMFNQDAAVWYNNTVDVSNGFHTTFQFQISSPTFGSLASDGLAFVVQNTGTPAIGDAASGGVEVGLHNLGPGIAVVFRTFNTNSVEIASCGPTKSVDIGCPVAQTPSGSVVVNDGAIHSAIIDYTLGQLQITVDGVLVLSTPIDIASQLTLTNGKAFVGFTAATGGRTEEADLKLWSYSSSGSGISFP